MGDRHQSQCGDHGCSRRARHRFDDQLLQRQQSKHCTSYLNAHLRNSRRFDRSVPRRTESTASIEHRKLRLCARDAYRSRLGRELRHHRGRRQPSRLEHLHVRSLTSRSHRLARSSCRPQPDHRLQRERVVLGQHRQRFDLDDRRQLSNPRR